MRKLLWIAAPTLALMSASAAAMTAQEAKALAERKACFGCHDVEKKGKPAAPAFRDIAARYRGDAAAADNLARKVREGGKGHWGEAHSMPANVRVTEQEARDLVNWVLAQ